MKNFFSTILLVLLTVGFINAQMGVTLTTVYSAGNNQKIEVRYAPDTDYEVDESSWSGQVIVLGFTSDVPITHTGHAAESTEITSFTNESTFAFVDAFYAGQPHVYVPADLGGTDDGNKYIYLIDADGATQAFENGVDELVFSFELPESWSSPDGSVFLNTVSLSDFQNTLPTMGNNGTGANEYNGDAAGTTLPIILKDFNVTKMGSFNAVEWSTSSEINSSHFVLERSIDNTNWERIVQVDAAGNSTTLQEYRYKDEFAFVSGNTYYYRLRMVDLDGAYEYSDVKYISYQKVDVFEPIRVNLYPNPAKNYLELVTEANVDINGSVLTTVNIFDLNGKLAMKEIINLNDSSIIDVENLVQGSYTVMITIGDNNPIHKKLIIID